MDLFMAFGGLPFFCRLNSFPEGVLRMFTLRPNLQRAPEYSDCYKDMKDPLLSWSETSLF